MIVYSGKPDDNVKMYLNFADVHVQCHSTLQTFQMCGVTRYMASGRDATSNYEFTGFGYIDELLVFPDALTASQIGELQQVYRKKLL